MGKLIIIEGLPGVGKTTLVNAIRNKNIKNLTIIDEIINKKITDEEIYTEDEFINNDIQKIKSIKDGIVIMDRGLISSFSYSQTKSIIDTSFDLSKANKLFAEYKDVLKEAKVIYLTNHLEDVKITGQDLNSPYGSKENQELLENISLYNLKKYCNNYKVKDYYKKNMEELIDEIIN